MAEPPVAKRARVGALASPDDALVVPRDVTARIRAALTTPGPDDTALGSNRFLLVSWNIDGIDNSGDRDRMLRCLAVAEQIATTQPAAVMMQEAVPPQLELLMAPQVLGLHYDIVCPENPRMPYYCVMLLHKRRVKVLGKSRTHHFAGSQMGRHFLAVDVVVDQVHAPLTLITTHLESTKSEKSQRIEQLIEVFAASVHSAARGSRTVVLAGDLNVRDEEVAAARKAARERSPRVDDIVDAWIWCGSPKASQFTWDTSINKNLNVPFSSRCRFDRCYFSSPVLTDGKGSEVVTKSSTVSGQKAVSIDGACWVASAIGLVGHSRIPAINRFPSDHWGIQITWTLPVVAPAQSLAEGPLASSSSTVSLAPSAMSDQERRRRRELALEKAEQRRNDFSVRGTESASKLHQKADLAAPREECVEEESEEAMLARAMALSVRATECTSKLDRKVEQVAPRDVSENDTEEESEEAMMARAIALSLQLTPAGTAAEERCAGGSSNIQRISVRPAFAGLAANGSEPASSAVTSDLD